MTTIRAYMTIEQSCKLAEILPLESADMSYSLNFDSGIYEISTTSYKNWVVPKYAQPDNGFGQVIPCWSLAALLDILPDNYIDNDTVYHPNLMKIKDGRYMIIYNASLYTSLYNNPVDACYEMIICLNELKML